jgi:hypothetical protein
MKQRPAATHHSTLLFLMLVYGAASLLHFAHNAVYLHDYPNLPEWLTSQGVWVSWCGVAAVGALGYWLYRRVSRRAGLAMITLYGVLGLGGLDHYTVAPMGAHSFVMNLTILTEAAAAAVLLVFVAHSMLLARRPARLRFDN